MKRVKTLQLIWVQSLQCTEVQSQVGQVGQKHETSVLKTEALIAKLKKGCPYKRFKRFKNIGLSVLEVFKMEE